MSLLLSGFSLNFRKSLDWELFFFLSTLLAMVPRIELWCATWHVYFCIIVYFANVACRYILRGSTSYTQNLDSLFSIVELICSWMLERNYERFWCILEILINIDCKIGLNEIFFSFRPLHWDLCDFGLNDFGYLILGLELA